MKAKTIPVYLFSFFMIMPLHALFPVLPMIRDELSASYSQIAVFVGCIGAIRIVLAVPSGYIADRFDKKKILIMSGFVSVVGLLVMVFSHNIYQLIASRILTGISSIVTTITILVVLSELAGSNSRGMMMSMNNVIHNAGGIVAPVFTGFLSAWYNWRLPFIINAGLILLSMGLIAVSIPALKPIHISKRDVKKPDGNGFLDTDFKSEIIRLIPVFAISIFIFFYRSSFRHNIIPFYARDVFNISIKALGSYISLIGFIAMVSIFVMGYLSDRYGRKVVLMPSIIFSTLAVFAMLLPEKWNPLLAVSILVGMGAIINSMPNILISDIASPGSVGKIIGINRIFADSGYLAGSIITGSILDHYGFRVPLYVVIGFAIFTLILITFFIHNKPKTA